MQLDLLKDIVSSIVGERAKGIVDLLASKKNVNEFLIAKKLNLTINQTRNILYKLSDEGLVSFVRKKDKKKGGWYTYFWTLNYGRSLIKFKDNISRNLENIKQQLRTKKTQKFYYCVNCNLEFNEESALTHNYVCPECGEVLELKDNLKETVVLEKEINKQENIMKELEQEIKIIQGKEEVAKERKRKLDEKKKIAERKAKKKKKEREMKKLRNLGKGKPTKILIKGNKKPKKKSRR